MLRFDRFVNLVYYWCVRGMDQKAREKFDRAILTVPADEIRRRIGAQEEVAPSWWKGEEAAARQGLAFAAAMGISVDLSNVSE